MDAAGFDTYRILPAGDERTCAACMALSGYEFKTAKAVATMEATFGMEDPEQAMNRTPWVSWDDKRENPDGSKGDAYYIKGDQKNYIGDRGAESLQASGLGILPVHGRCRCVAELIE
jgi:hypothetical protein